MIFEQQPVCPEQVGIGMTKLQVAVRYDVECSDDAMDAINQSYEHHCISDAASVVPRYEVLVSTSYRSVIDFACDYVPLHLIDFPVVDLNGQKLIPTDPMVVMEAIVNHDGLEAISGEGHGDVFLVSPADKEVLVHGSGFLSNKQYWGSNGNVVLLQEPPVNVVITRRIILLEDVTCIEILPDIRSLLQKAFPLII